LKDADPYLSSPPSISTESAIALSGTPSGGRWRGSTGTAVEWAAATGGTSSVPRVRVLAAVVAKRGEESERWGHR
jgi:hypothetical protein